MCRFTLWVREGAQSTVEKQNTARASCKEAVCVCVRYWEKRQAGPTGAGTGGQAQKRERGGGQERRRDRTGRRLGWQTARCRRGTNAPPHGYLVRAGTHSGAPGTRGCCSHGPHKSGTLSLPPGLSQSESAPGASASAPGHLRRDQPDVLRGPLARAGGMTDCFFNVPSSLLSCMHHIGLGHLDRLLCVLLSRRITACMR